MKHVTRNKRLAEFLIPRRSNKVNETTGKPKVKAAEDK